MCDVRGSARWCRSSTGPPSTGSSSSPTSAALTLAAEADVLIHHAQYTDDEFPAKAHCGHAATSYAVGLAAEAGTKQVVLFHHDPSRTDDQVDAIGAHHRADAPPVIVNPAAEAMVIELPAS